MADELMFIKKSTVKATSDAIREVKGTTDAINPKNWSEEIKGLSASGGGDLVRYVTFMSWDGSAELYKKPTIAGDDCVDVVAKGLMTKPTKPSTNTQNFTYAGWNTTVGESADSNALKNIVKDRVVYASFSASVRYYTVTYMDESETLNTVEVTYGADASGYIPEKEGYVFAGWNPSVDSVTDDITTYATWEVDQGWLVAMPSAEVLPKTGVQAGCMKYTPDGSKLIVADSGSNRLIMYDATTNPYTKLYETIPNSSKKILSLEISPDGATLVVALNYNWNAYNSMLKVYSIGSTSLSAKSSVFPTANLSSTTTPIYLAFNNAGTRLAITMTNKYCIFNTESSKWTLEKTITGANYSRLLYSLDDTKLYILVAGGYSSQNVKILDVQNDYADITNTYIGTVSRPGSSSSGGRMAITPDGRYIVCGAVDQFEQSYILYVMDTSTTPYTFKIVPDTKSLYGSITDVSMSADGSMFAIATSKEPYMVVYDMETLTPKELPKVPITASGRACAFNNDDTELAVGCYNGDPTMVVYQVKK